MKILSVAANNRRHLFEVRTRSKTLFSPTPKLTEALTSRARNQHRAPSHKTLDMPFHVRLPAMRSRRQRVPRGQNNASRAPHSAGSKAPRRDAMKERGLRSP